MESEVKTVTVDVADAFAIKSDTGELCRLCANTDNQLMPIFRGEGLEHSIATKIEKYLPIINVTELDKLPLQICYQCASTLIAWNNLYEGCRVADKRLREILCIDDKLYPEDETFEDYVDDYRDNYDEQTHNIPTPTPSTSNLESNILRPDATDITQLNDAKTFNETELDSTDERYVWKKKSRCAVDKTPEVSATKNEAKKRTMATARKSKPNKLPVTKQTPKVAIKMNAKQKNSVVWKKQRFPRENLDKQCVKCGRRFTRNSSLKVHVRKGVCTRNSPGKRNSSRLVSPENQVEVVTRSANAAAESNPAKASPSKEQKDGGSVGERRRRAKRVPADPTKAAFFRDHRIVIDGVEMLKCDRCDYVCAMRHRFGEHYRIHTGEKPYTCHHCGKTFRTKAFIQKHLLAVHEGEKKFTCDICSRAFSDRRFVECHRYIHTGEKPFVCDVCGKAFRQSSTLMMHKRFHLNIRNHRCDVCSRTFVRRSHLTVHMKRHRNIRDYVCEQCGKAFVDGRMLRDHGVVHSDDRPFACDICGSGFKLKKHLKQHGRVHREDKKVVKNG